MLNMARSPLRHIRIITEKQDLISLKQVNMSLTILLQIMLEVWDGLIQVIPMENI